MPAVAERRAGRFPPRQVLVVLLLGSAAVAALLPVGYRPLGVPAQLVLGAVAVIALYLAALQVVTGLPELADGIARWRLGPWYLLWGMCTFGVASLTWLTPQTGSATRIELASVVDALAVALVAVVVWTAGYCLGPPRGVRALAGRGLSLLLSGTTTALRGGTMPWVLYGLGSATRLATVGLTGRFGYVGDPSGLTSQALPYGQLLQALSTLTGVAIAAAAYRAFSPAIRGSKATLWTLVGIEIVVGALAGGKQSFILAVLAVLIPYGVVRGRISLRILLAGAMVFLWIAVPFNAAYRDLVRTQQDTLAPGEAVEAAPGVLSDTAGDDSRSVGGRLLDSAVTMLTRVRLIDSVAIITQRTPNPIPYREPHELATAPFAGLVPRVLWPDKPVYATGYEFSQEYYGLPSEVYTSSAVTPLGDLYRHGGLLPVAVGMLLLGLCCRLLDMLFRPERDPRAICFLLVFLPLFVKFEVDMYSLIMSVPAAVLTATLGARLMCRGTPAPVGAAR